MQGAVMNTQKPKAIVFIDYEHWYFSMVNNFKLRPNIRAWRNKVAESYDIVEMLIFADFSKEMLVNELAKMREVTNAIIETRSSNGYLKKDYTDFIILDYIYQRAITLKDVDNFIIFTGDGHFSSVIAFLKNQCGKQVGVCAVRNSFSTQLRDIASWWYELPDDGDVLKDVCGVLIENFRYIEREREEKGRVIRATFTKTVDNVATHYDLDKDIVKDGLIYLINNDYVYRDQEKISFNEFIYVLKVRWDKVDAEDAFKVG